jgi:hypothetical protein
MGEHGVFHYNPIDGIGSLDLEGFHFRVHEQVSEKGVPIPPKYTGPDPEFYFNRRHHSTDLHPFLYGRLTAQHSIIYDVYNTKFWRSPLHCTKFAIKGKIFSPPYYVIEESMPKRLKDFMTYKQRWVEAFYAEQHPVIPYLYWRTLEEIEPHTVYGLQKGAPFLVASACFVDRKRFHRGLKEIIDILEPETIYAMAYPDNIPDELKDKTRFVYYNPKIHYMSQDGNKRHIGTYAAQERLDINVEEYNLTREEIASYARGEDKIFKRLKERFEVEEDIREDENFAQRYQDAYANYLDDIEYTIRLRTFESGNSALFMTVYKAAESRRLKSNKAEDAANTALKSTKGASDKELRDLALAAARRKGRILDTEEDDDTD